jgi:hypothetical protein
MALPDSGHSGERLFGISDRPLAVDAAVIALRQRVE